MATQAAGSIPAIPSARSLVSAHHAGRTGPLASGGAIPRNRYLFTL